MIEKIPALKAIPDCTPQYVMAIIRPLLIEGIIARTEIEGAAYFYYDGPTVKPEELYAQTEQLINDLEDCKL